MQIVKGASFLVAAGAIVFVVLANASPEAGDAGPDTWASEAELELLAGAEADRCVHAGPGRKLCSWSLSGRLLRPGGTPAEERAEVVSLICELPVKVDGAAQGPCRTHARGDRTAEAATSDLPHVSSRGPALDREEVWRELSEARTVTALSHLMGAVPNACSLRLQSDYQRCEWRLTEGQGPLAALAPAEGAGVLRCALPLDGSDRDPTSCGVVRLD